MSEASENQFFKVYA